MSNLRCVFDTNVSVSALLFEHSTPARAFYKALNDGKVLLSHDTIAELKEVISRQKFDRYLSQQDRDRFLAMLVLKGEIVEITESICACRDVKDDKFLELAVNGEADWLITGDDDLLVLHPFREVTIVTPAVYLELTSAS